jgi:topoisomerase-4 subunit A
MVKSNPALIQSVYFGFANSEISMWDEKIHRLTFKDVPMMSPDSTFSSPFGKLQSFEIVQTIETIPEGNWAVSESEPVQETLFDDE